jgi:transposase-like protein
MTMEHCPLCDSTRIVADIYMYGDDADGNRGEPVALYTCLGCDFEWEDFTPFPIRREPDPDAAYDQRRDDQWR